jgi:mono/diheme cytochrome c family protein
MLKTRLESARGRLGARPVLLSLVVCATAALAIACSGSEGDLAAEQVQALAAPKGPGAENRQVADGRHIFRFDTFGDEIKWTDTLRLHEVIRTSVTPVAALQVGLKVDSEALPPEVVQGIQDGSISLNSPATTVALLKLDAVVGLKGKVENIGGVDVLTQIGTTCALCHSTVDNSFAQGIGKRLDGWPNLDLNPGGIIALSPVLTSTQTAVFSSWGRGKYDPRFNIDGLNKPVVIPPAYGLEGVHKITFTGDGDDIAYWNRYVAVTQMGGQGTFSDPRLVVNGVPVSITNGTQDLVSSKLPALQAYQLSLKKPAPPAGSFDAAAAARGKVVFEGAGQCSSCHAGPLFTDAPTLHPPEDSMAEPEVPSYASRSATKMYRTTPLRALWQHARYFHDGSAATLDAVVTTYNTRRALGLTAQQRSDLAEYLKSI